MWLFTKYGFYSTACGRKGDGNYGNPVNPDIIMVRARTEQHLLNLQDRFPVLQEYKIHDDVKVDYRYRLFVPKSIWKVVAADLIEEMDYDKFKPQVEQYADEHDQPQDYHQLCLDVWHVMYQLLD